MDLDSEILEETRFVEHHLHNRSRAYGKSGDQSGDDWAVENGLTSFQCISGNGDFGSDANDEAKIFGPDDTPFISGQTLFDPGNVLIVGVSSGTPYVLRMVWSDTDILTGIAAGDYTSEHILFDSANPQLSAGVPIRFDCPKLPVGTKVWMQCKNATDNATLDFLIDSHGYMEGQS